MVFTSEPFNVIAIQPPVSGGGAPTVNRQVVIATPNGGVMVNMTGTRQEVAAPGVMVQEG